MEISIALEVAFLQILQEKAEINIRNLISFAISVFRAEQFSGCQKSAEFYCALLHLNQVPFDPNNIFYYKKFYKLMILIAVEKDYLEFNTTMDVNRFLSIINETFILLDKLVSSTESDKINTENFITENNINNILHLEILVVTFIHEFFLSLPASSKSFSQIGTDFFICCFQHIYSILMKIKGDQKGQIHMCITAYLISLIPIIIDNLPAETIQSFIPSLSQLIIKYVAIEDSDNSDPHHLFTEEFDMKITSRGFCLELFSRLTKIDPNSALKLITNDLMTSYLVANALSITARTSLFSPIFNIAYQMINLPIEEIVKFIPKPIVFRDFLYLYSCYIYFLNETEANGLVPQNLIQLLTEISKINDPQYEVHHSFNIRLLTFALSKNFPFDGSMCEYVLKYFDNTLSSDGIEFLIQFLSLPNMVINENVINRIKDSFPPLICKLLAMKNYDDELEEKYIKMLDKVYDLFLLVLQKHPEIIPEVLPSIFAHFINTCHFHQSCQIKSIFRYLSFVIENCEFISFSDPFISEISNVVDPNIMKCNIQPQSLIPVLAILIQAIRIEDNYGAINSIYDWGRVVIQFISKTRNFYTTDQNDGGKNYTACEIIAWELYRYLELISYDDDPIYDNCIAAIMLIFIHILESGCYLSERIYGTLRDIGQLFTHSRKERIVTLGTALFAGYVVTHPSKMNESRSDQFNKFLYDNVGMFFGDAERLIIKEALLRILDFNPALKNSVQALIVSIGKFTMAELYKDYLDRNEFIWNRKLLGITTDYELQKQDANFWIFDNVIHEM
ncbi:hypothetical protein TRFO_34147 [Tritrichomonas foetus]|uniref:Uncharacterized protein n=1 Tax=Tritrichomonas foetus TaxID=1144522 RepID=A0A1J4JQ70_9EUKA|nr:hypothetical protein TRFO_34147 [Tritrichomonas foetus]|eukprot:OHS99380.1 hypothetical protein TRFO_34147 [Tritrichomonas foetus]